MSYAGHIPISTNVWRPEIHESLDDKPLATTISDIFIDFPYDRLPSNAYLAWFLRPEGVACTLIFYLVSKPIMKMLPIAPKSTAFRNCVAIHNISLAIFSGIVAWNSAVINVQHFLEYGLFDTYCDPNGTLWHDSGFGAWAVIFYISKYYEFVDTWILVWKQKQPSFLQVYHHTGVAFCMWIGVLSQSSWLVFAVTLNAFIHTLMYTYFFIKTVSPTTQIKAAKHLTVAQIT
uniref:Elongation of fatty acids protein n=1 Tax=Craspedostauros australis TaxID=1486917 RepID=A0A7R9ZSX7_9STRA